MREREFVSFVPVCFKRENSKRKEKPRTGAASSPSPFPPSPPNCATGCVSQKAYFSFWCCPAEGGGLAVVRCWLARAASWAL